MFKGNVFVKRSCVIIAILFVGMLVLAFFESIAVGGGSDAAKKMKPNLFFSFAKPVRRDFKKTIRWFGCVKSKSAVRLKALTEGVVERIEVKDDSTIGKGELIFALGGKSLLGRISALRNKSKNLEARLALATQMVQTKQLAVSLKFAKNEDVTIVEDALDQVISAKALCDAELQRLMENREIRAPFDGVFTARVVSVGSTVVAEEVLASVIDVKRVFILATLFPNINANALKGKKCVIRLSGGKTLKAEITGVSPRKTPNGATIARIEGANLADKLGVGEMVDGIVVESIAEAAIAIPESAVVLNTQNHPCVFVKTATEFEKRRIETGASEEGLIEVVSGLTPNESVVTRGAYELMHRNFNKIYKVAD